jgi:hypothetical protein
MTLLSWPERSPVAGAVPLILRSIILLLAAIVDRQAFEV